ncbi:hypothetical protein [Bacteroides hominis]|uniref:hypothetical protein n=1 Tax=Bacteroides hominis TaxID=2763023 RepID=UPI00164BD85D|nr:hypothetical protein [Bacteroides hominis (ex Liu et al. 2022)]MBC5614284.1 hypothetical protein [Bacteroides hominis (ex Liu et al. 2022)]
MNAISLILSIIAVSVTVYNCYRQYFMKKEEIALTVSSALIENDKLKVCLLYTNTGNQTTTITNASIMLDTSSRIRYDKENQASVCNWITPFTIFEKEQKIITIYYRLPEFKDIDINNISIRILSEYTNRKGILFEDHYPVGHLATDDTKKCFVCILTNTHRLSQNRVIMSFQ